MSRQTARLVTDQLHMRPALIASRYASLAGLDVTSNGMIADIQALADADPVTEEQQHENRSRELVQAYGLSYSGEASSRKPFLFGSGKAIIPVHGILINRFSYSWGFATGYNFLRNQIAAALADDDVEGIIYDVNSNGGTVAGCRETADIIFAASAKGGGKPSLAVVDHNCYSAAYMLMSGADRLVVTPTGGAGSIGVVVMHMDVSGALERMGIKVTFISAPLDGHKVDGNPYEKLSKEVKEDIQVEIEKMYDTFVSTVTRNRPSLTEQAVRDTKARCYGADEALSLGLIDAIAAPDVALTGFFEDEDSDYYHKQKEQEEMSDTKKTEDKPDAVDAVAVRTAERERVKGIQSHPEADGRRGLADHLAHETDMSVEAAGKIMAKAPKEAAPVAAKQEETKQDNHFKNAMDNSPSPNVGADGKAAESDADGGNKPSRAAQIREAHRLATGRKAPEQK